MRSITNERYNRGDGIGRCNKAENDYGRGGGRNPQDARRYLDIAEEKMRSSRSEH